MRFVPSDVTETRLLSSNAFRCCDTAGRLIGRPSASSLTVRGARRNSSSRNRRFGSAIAEKGSVFDMAGTLRQTGRGGKKIVRCSVRERHASFEPRSGRCST
ncbi:hypothetical protein RHECNPAF_770034 [Rhizobium etli CNPAF512]|nr:hypothetical protein RHECNPAF_770034 [Rhizobium etli CNPAF512]